MSAPRCHVCQRLAEPVVVQTADGRRWCAGCHREARERAGVEVVEAGREHRAARRIFGDAVLSGAAVWAAEARLDAAIDAYDALRPEVKP